MLTTDAAGQLLWRLKETHPGFREIALVCAENRVYFSGCETNAKAPATAIVNLIQAVYDHNPEQARKILRERIYSSAPLTEMCWGMLKVAARRATAPLLPRDHRIELNAHELLNLPLHRTPEPPALPAPAPPHAGHAAFMKLGHRLAQAVSREGPRHTWNRPIAALLVSAEGELLSWGINSNAKNKTEHAEVNMIQSWHERTGRPLPRGAVIYTTLKSCRMCAGMIWHCAEDFRNIRVYFGEYDPGPNARETILNAGSLERRRACPSELQLELEEHLDVP